MRQRNRPGSQPPLHARMRTLAKVHERGDELRRAADDLEKAIGENSIPRLVGAWAKARRLWCDITGEALL